MSAGTSANDSTRTWPFVASPVRGVGSSSRRSISTVRLPASRAAYLVPAAGVDGETGALRPLLAGKTARDGRAAAYVCRRGVCDAPVGDAGALEAALAAGAA